MSQLLLTVFLGPVGRFHGFECAVLRAARYGPGRGTAGRNGLVFAALAKKKSRPTNDEETRDEGACRGVASYKTTGLGGSHHLL